jgi:putative ABC transport system substrate-binding protein
MRRREFIAGLTGIAAWAPLAAAAQQPPPAQRGALPVVGFLSYDALPADRIRAFLKGLGETGIAEDQTVTIEYHWLQRDRLLAVVDDLVRRRVAVIVANGGPNLASAVEAATSSIPIVFSVGDDPVKLGLVASLARPGGNATGINFLFREVVAKRLALLNALVPKAARIAVLVGPGDTLNVPEVQKAARTNGQQIRVLRANTSREIDAAFSTFGQERPDALFVAPDAFFTGQRVQLSTLAARERIPASYATREIVDAGGLMSYGTNLAEALRQVGIYVGSILKGTKPADLPVLQSTRFEFVINLQTARLLGIEVPPMLAIADEVIE